MKRKYIMAGVLLSLSLSLWGGTAFANSSTSVGEPENGTEVWQVPHKPKGTKTRLGIQPKTERPAEKKAEKPKPKAKKPVENVSSSSR